ncbi:MAG: S8 family peptidase, partial [Deltaproteobacteria bacterium]
MKKNTMLKSWKITVSSLAVVLALIGCSLKSQFDKSPVMFGASVPAVADTYMQFTPSIPTGVTGPFSLAEGPFWVQVDNSTGEISGYPDFKSNSIPIRIRGTSSENGNTVALTPFIVEAKGDPLVAEQWSTFNNQQTSYAKSRGRFNEDLGVRDVIRSGITGKNVKIAISDTGLDINHEDLKANVLAGASKNYNPLGLTDDPTLRPSAEDPLAEDHGTSVAGIIAMEGWNNIGGRGIAPNAKIAGLNFLSYQSDTSYLDQISRPFDIVNQSWGSGAPFFAPEDSLYRQALESGVTNLSAGKGAIYVKAAGNSFEDGINAACDPNNKNPQTIVVGATNSEGVHSSYSSSGANLWISGAGGEYGFDSFFYDLLQRYLSDPTKPEDIKNRIRAALNFAPFFSPAIVTTDNSSCDVGYSHHYVENTLIAPSFSLFNFDLSQPGRGTPHKDNPSCNYTSSFNGTSAATPSVVGVIALLLEKKPQLTWREVKDILAKTARKVDPNSVNITLGDDITGHVNEPGWIRNAANYNFHNYYGFGRIDAAA